MTTSSIAYNNASFQKFLDWTNQTEILGKEILALKKPSYKTLLDVGAGNGDLTDTYIGSFEKALLLEPTLPFYERLTERFPTATVMQIKAEDFKANGSNFDLIVASHVLYYVEKPFDIINHLLFALNKGGRLVIVLVDKDCAYLKFIDTFYYKITGMKHNFTDILWSDITAYMESQSLHTEVREVSLNLHAPSLDDYLSLSDFIFNVDLSQISDKMIDEMRTYLTDYLGADGLSIDAGNRVMVVEK